MHYTDDLKVALILKSTQVEESLLGAIDVDSNERVAIEFLHLHPSGGNNVITLTGKIAVPFGQNDNELLLLENKIGNPDGIFPCNTGQKPTIALGSATQVEGYALYRIINK